MNSSFQALTLPAVISKEEDDGVLRQTKLVNSLQGLAHLLVHKTHGRVVCKRGGCEQMEVAVWQPRGDRAPLLTSTTVGRR